MLPLFLYLTLGLAFAAWFVPAGAARLDPAARHGSLGFRLLILPATVALWPLLVWRLWRMTP